MVGVLALSDFRESESWSIARSVVCAILELADSCSRTLESRRVANKVKGLSVTLLNEIAKGYEGSGDPAFLEMASETIDLLETELRKFRLKGILGCRQFHLLQRNLGDVRISLNHMQAQFLPVI